MRLSRTNVEEQHQQRDGEARGIDELGGVGDQNEIRFNEVLQSVHDKLSLISRGIVRHPDQQLTFLRDGRKVLYLMFGGLGGK